MKKLLIIALIICSCKTTKVNKETGDIVPTWTKKHMQKIHKHGFYAGGKYIEYKDEKKLNTVKK